MVSQSERASSRLWNAAIVAYIVHVIISLPFLFVPTGKSGPEEAGSLVGAVLGALLGALLWPLFIVWIASFWRSNQTQRRKVRVFLVATVVLVALRLVSMFAIAGVRVYLARAKSAEARSTVGAISRNAAAAFERESELLGQGRTLCGSAPPVPDFVPGGRGYTPSEREGTDWNTTGWRCVDFKVMTRQYYQYTYTAGGPYKGPARGGPDPGPNGFEVAAEGDLDGDGVTSLFTQIGKVDPASGKVVLSAEIFVDKEFE